MNNKQNKWMKEYPNKLKIKFKIFNFNFANSIFCIKM